MYHNSIRQHKKLHGLDELYIISSSVVLTSHVFYFIFLMQTQKGEVVVSKIQSYPRMLLFSSPVLVLWNICQHLTFCEHNLKFPLAEFKG